VVSTKQVELLQMLASRLERLSADSRWARRASGLRGNIIKLLEEAGTENSVDTSRVELLTQVAFDILRQAAADIPDIESLLKKYNHQA
jgi:hypothetical protein